MFTRISNNRLAAPTGPATSIVNNVLENAKKFGVLPAALAKELSERESIITQLLITIPDEKKIEGYFTDFLFVNNIPWSKTRDLMIKALAAPTNGADVEDVLDFALEHYKRKKNIAQTKQIIDDGLRLQSSSRLSNIFGMLTDALQNKPVSMLGIQFGSENMKDIFVFNRLVGLSLAKPEEDLEMLRREFVTSLDELERTREVDDRYKAIFQALQSIEFNNQLTNITKFVTNMFEMSLNDPVMLAFRRVLIQLKLGVEFRRQFFSDFENTQTSEGIRDKSGDPGQDAINRDLAEQIKRVLSDDTNYNFVKLAQTSPTSNPDLKTKVNQFLDDTIKNLTIVKVGLETVKNSPGDPAFQNITPAIKGLVGPSIEVVNTTITKVNELKGFLSNGTLNAEQVFDKFIEYWDTMGSKLVTTFNGLPDNLPILKDIDDFAKSMGINTEIFTNIFGILIGVETVRSLSGNFKTAIMGALSLIAANENFNKIKLSKIVGKPVPKSDTTVDAKVLADAFRTMGANQDQVNDLLALKAYAEAVRATIQDRENTLAAKMTGVVKTNTDSQINSPLSSNKDAQQEYSRFYQYLVLVNNNLNYYMDLIDALVKQVRTDPLNETKILEKTGPVLRQRAEIEALITEVRGKLIKYRSWVVIAGETQNRARLMQDLGVLIPEIEKYMATGISIADIFLAPGGLSAKMKEISDSLIRDRDKLYAEIQKAKNIQKVPVRFRTVPKPTAQPEAPQFLGTNEQESMNPTFSTFEDRPK